MLETSKCQTYELINLHKSSAANASFQNSPTTTLVLGSHGYESCHFPVTTRKTIKKSRKFSVFCLLPFKKLIAFHIVVKYCCSFQCFFFRKAIIYVFHKNAPASYTKVIWRLSFINDVTRKFLYLWKGLYVGLCLFAKCLLFSSELNGRKISGKFNRRGIEKMSQHDNF